MQLMENDDLMPPPAGIEVFEFAAACHRCLLFLMSSLKKTVVAYCADCSTISAAQRSNGDSEDVAFLHKIVS